MTNFLATRRLNAQRMIDGAPATGVDLIGAESGRPFAFVYATLVDANEQVQALATGNDEDDLHTAIALAGLRQLERNPRLLAEPVEEGTPITVDAAQVQRFLGGRVAVEGDSLGLFEIDI